MILSYILLCCIPHYPPILCYNIAYFYYVALYVYFILLYSMLVFVRKCVNVCEHVWTCVSLCECVWTYLKCAKCASIWYIVCKWVTMCEQSANVCVNKFHNMRAWVNILCENMQHVCEHAPTFWEWHWMVQQQRPAIQRPLIVVMSWRSRQICGPSLRVCGSWEHACN